MVSIRTLALLLVPLLLAGCAAPPVEEPVGPAAAPESTTADATTEPAGSTQEVEGGWLFQFGTPVAANSYLGSGWSKIDFPASAQEANLTVEWASAAATPGGMLFQLRGEDGTIVWETTFEASPGTSTLLADDWAGASYVRMEPITGVAADMEYKVTLAFGA